MVADLCKPKTHPEHRDWTMSIPARPDYDPDLVIRDSLDDIPKLLERLEAAEARAERAEAALRDVRRSLSRLRWWDLSLRGGCERLMRRIDQALASGKGAAHDA